MKENKHGAVKIASNMYVKTIGGIVFLFSYNTPVAFESPYGKFRTNAHFSATTTRHINKYFGKGVGEIAEHQTIMKMAGLA
tara:strand:+ start:159 stop:401 length:243 start_codon:yes stop_codon:yes gene_type:complete